MENRGAFGTKRSRNDGEIRQNTLPDLLLAAAIAFFFFARVGYWAELGISSGRVWGKRDSSSDVRLWNMSTEYASGVDGMEFRAWIV
jgi:hypothetical protein